MQRDVYKKKTVNWGFSQTQRRREGFPASLYVPSDEPALRSKYATTGLDVAAMVREATSETVGDEAEMLVTTGRKPREGENSKQ